MYPTLTDLLRGLFGIHLPLPVMTFGFAVFFAFLGGYWAFSSELKRKEKAGLVLTTTVSQTIGRKPQPLDILLNGFLGFLLGFKLPYIVVNYTHFSADPPSFLFNREGNLLTGLIGAVLLATWTWYEKNKVSLAVPKVVEEKIYPHELLGTTVMIAAGAGIVGAKIFDNLENWDRFISDPIGNLFSGSGLTFYGGFIFGAIAVLLYMNKYGVKPLIMLDVGAAGMMLAYAIGRVGCQIAGDGDWGIVNTAPKPSWLSWAPDWVWAYNYPNNVGDEGVPIPGCIGLHCHVLNPPVFPTPLYEIIVCLVLFGVLWAIRKRIKVNGALFCVYLVMNGIERFFIELIRVNTRYHIGKLAFSQAELISVLLFLTGCIGYFYLNQRAKMQAVKPEIQPV